MISTEFDSQFPLSPIPNYSLHFLPTTHISGAPNEDIVQNHLNIALLNIF